MGDGVEGFGGEGGEGARRERAVEFAANVDRAKRTIVALQGPGASSVPYLLLVELIESLAQDVLKR